MLGGGTGHRAQDTGQRRQVRDGHAGGAGGGQVVGGLRKTWFKLTVNEPSALGTYTLMYLGGMEGGSMQGETSSTSCYHGGEIPPRWISLTSDPPRPSNSTDTTGTS